MATSDKKNAYKIRGVIEQNILKSVLHYYYMGTEAATEQARAAYSRLSQHIVNDLFKEPKIEIILKRGKKT